MTERIDNQDSGPRPNHELRQDVASADLLRPDDDRPSTFLERNSTLILCLALFFLPLVSLGAVKSLKVYSTDIRQWLPSGFEEARTYDRFVEQFGLDEMVVISWDGATIDNPRVLELCQLLREQADEQGPIFQRVTCGPDLIEEIKSVGVSQAEALRRAEGLMIGPDGKTTAVAAYPVERLKNDRRQLVDRIYDVAQSELGLPPEAIKAGGPVVDGAAIELESKRSLGQFLWMSIAAVFLLTWFRMKDLPLTILVIFFSCLCAAISLSILYFSGGEMNLTMVMLPTLTFILGVSGCVHMVNYYRKASTLGHGIHSADRAMKDARYPVSLSAMTTAAGLASLGVSRVAPIRSFGFYAALGVLASLVIILLVLPAALYLLKGRISRWFSAHGTMTRRERISGVSRSTSILVNWVCRSHGLVVVPVLIGVSVLGVGVIHLKASVKLQSRFNARAKILKDYEWLENNLGPLVPMEVVLNIREESGLTTWQQLQLVKTIQNAIQQTTRVSATLSAATFEPTIPRGTSLRSRVEARTKKRKWEQEISNFQDIGLVQLDGEDTSWRISLRVAALNDIDYGRFLESIDINVNNQLDHLSVPGVSAVLTGGIPLVYKAQHQILRDLMTSFVTAFLFISLILIFVLKSFRSGIVAMIPNVFPPLVVFGAMGWMGRRVEIGSVMTASVALGIAVDDTIHFLTWYRRGTMEGLSRYKSIRYAFEHCAKAMIDTSLICGLGVAPFLFGIFMPTVNFAMLLMVMLFAALLGDLILLPAILAGPAGILFRARIRKPKVPPGETTEPVRATGEHQKISV